MTRRTRSKHAEKYPVFLKWNDPDEIPTDELSKQWGVSEKVVFSLKGVCMRTPMVYKLLTEKYGYTDEEIPLWIKRPSDVIDTRSGVDEAGSVEGETGSDLDEDSSKGLERTVHVAPKPKTEESGVSPEQVQNTLDGSIAQPGVASPSQTQPDGSAAQPSSAYLDGSAADTSDEEDILKNIAMDVAVRELTIRTQAIMKKVALSPTILICYNYFVQAKDPETGMRFFEGDLADFLNFCVRFTMEKGFGITPAMITGQPSFLQLMKEQERHRGEGLNYIQLWVNENEENETEIKD